MKVSIHAQAPADALVQIRFMQGVNYYIKLIRPAAADDILASHCRSKEKLRQYARNKGWELLEI